MHLRFALSSFINNISVSLSQANRSSKPITRESCSAKASTILMVLLPQPEDRSTNILFMKLDANAFNA